MSTENASANPEMYSRNRRGSITQAALTNLFQRGNSIPNGSGFPAQSNGPIDPNRRRLSVNTLGLSGSSSASAQPYNIRRGSLSTNSNNSDSIDETVIEDDDFGSRTAPTTPFVRRMSFGGTSMRTVRPGGSPGTGNPTSPPSYPLHSGQKSSRGSSFSVAWSATGRRGSSGLPTSPPPQASNTNYPRAPSDSYPRLDQHGFNWSEQLRSRAESSVSAARPSFSFASGSPPRGNSIHERSKSISEMPPPPVQASAMKPKQERQRPDAFQERILKGDFYMD